MMREEDFTKRSFAELARMTALVVTIVAIFVLVIVGFLKAADAVFALTFGILIAVIFDAGARGLGYLLPWDRRLRVLTVIVLAFAALLAVTWWGGTEVAAEVRSFIGEMEKLLRHSQTVLHTKRPEWLPADVTKLLPDGSVFVGSAEKVVKKLIECVVFFGVALFVGAFCAWEPLVYKAAFLSLLPRDRRARVSEVMDESAHAMRSWLTGRGITMSLIFVFTLCALVAIRMPNPELLALQAGIFTFLPTLGPLLAGIVIVVAGLAQGESMALYGLGTYVLVQFLESHVITPVVQRRTIRIPPAITVALQLIVASLFGLLAVVVIIPLAASAKVFIEELYVKDGLGGGWQTHAGGGRHPGLLAGWFARVKQKYHR